jgi:hypothetical protein
MEDQSMADNKPSDERNGSFLDSMWCCKVCDGEIPDGHTDNCDIWKLEKKHRDFIANEYNTVLRERDNLATYKANWDGLMSRIMEHCPAILNSAPAPADAIFEALKGSTNSGGSEQ